MVGVRLIIMDPQQVKPAIPWVRGCQIIMAHSQNRACHGPRRTAGCVAAPPPKGNAARGAQTAPARGAQTTVPPNSQYTSRSCRDWRRATFHAARNQRRGACRRLIPVLNVFIEGHQLVTHRFSRALELTGGHIRGGLPSFIQSRAVINKYTKRPHGFLMCRFLTGAHLFAS